MTISWFHEKNHPPHNTSTFWGFLDQGTAMMMVPRNMVVTAVNLPPTVVGTSTAEECVCLPRGVPGEPTEVVVCFLKWTNSESLQSPSPETHLRYGMQLTLVTSIWKESCIHRSHMTFEVLKKILQVQHTSFMSTFQVLYGGFLKWGYPQIIHLLMVFLARHGRSTVKGRNASKVDEEPENECLTAVRGASFGI